MTGISSGGGGGYDYVMAGYPSDAEEGESLYHLTENAAFVYSGSAWVEQTVTDHSQLSGVNEGDHRNDSRVSDLAPIQSVNGRTGDVTGLFEASDYNPESDTHSRYTDGEAANAAPVQSVGGQTGSVTVSVLQSQTTPYERVGSGGGSSISGTVDSSDWSEDVYYVAAFKVTHSDAFGQEFDVYVDGQLEGSSGTITDSESFTTGVSGVYDLPANWTVSAGEDVSTIYVDMSAYYYVPTTNYMLEIQ